MPLAVYGVVFVMAGSPDFTGCTFADNIKGASLPCGSVFALLKHSCRIGLRRGFVDHGRHRIGGKHRVFAQHNLCQRRAHAFPSQKLASDRA
jgi:hypothetical protein